MYLSTHSCATAHDFHMIPLLLQKVILFSYSFTKVKIEINRDIQAQLKINCQQVYPHVGNHVNEGIYNEVLATEVRRARTWKDFIFPELQGSLKIELYPAPIRRFQMSSKKEHPTRGCCFKKWFLLTLTKENYYILI